MKEKDKKNKTLGALITATGATTGAAIGGHVGIKKMKKVYKKSEEIGKKTSENIDKMGKDVDALIRLRKDPDISKNPEMVKGIDKRLQEKMERIDNDILRYDNTTKKTIKMGNKKFWKSLGTGAAIGAGVGFGVAVGAKAIKKHKNKDMEKKYSVLMTEEELRIFSRHTPKNLEKYKELTDKEIKDMSDGELDYYIDSEADKASRNENRYIRKKFPKYLAVGAGSGAAAGALLAGKGARIGGGAYGAMLGGVAGAVGASYRGSKKAQEEGHSRDTKSRKLAARADKIRGGNSYIRMKEREDRIRQQQLDAQRNQAILAAALR